MSFEEIKQKALQEKAAYDNLEIPRIIIGSVTCGKAAGAVTVREKFESALKEKGINARVLEGGCLGMCYAEPLVEIGLSDGRRILFKDVTEKTVQELVDDVIADGKNREDLALCTFGDVAVEGLPKFEELPMIKSQKRIVLRNCGIVDPTSIYQYIAAGGYSGLKRALEMSREEVVNEIKTSGLRGRGGAGFPTGLKWQFALASKNDKKYMICNADEGDPGAFMDRAVLESDPHAVLEGLVIGAYAIGADEAIIYARAEYPLAISRLETAITKMEELGFAGKGVMGTDFNIKIKIKQGAGAFVCGEETALMASIEGERGMPRTRPPFPAQAGLFGKPTNINNVETLANVSEILNKGADWFASSGTEKCKGSKTFALAGKINRTGLIEVPMGITLREIIYGVGGGILNDKEFKAVQTGGPSGGCLPAQVLDTPVDYETLAAAGSIMGSGGMVVMDVETCMVDVARYFLDFTQKESCGKCVPCRMGTKKMLEILEDICNGDATMEVIGDLRELAESIKGGSLCGLGQTAPNPVLTTMKYFMDEYEAHVKDKRCPALKCKVMLEFEVDQEACKLCGSCKRNCPSDAVTGDKKTEQPYAIHKDKCIQCGMCYSVCPYDAIVKKSPGLATAKAV